MIMADSNLRTLLDFQYRPHFRAERGQHGQGSNKQGKSGQDTLIRVPLGTIVKDFETQEILADLVETGQRVIAAKGGRGGRGNARFVRASHQVPREWEPGEYGEEKVLLLELKSLADVGLVGLPNAGKSTLLSKLSAARPKIASYPFTTLTPHLGIVKFRDFGSLVFADIPGLIEGAHAGKGMGDQFLRHIERTRLLVVLLDCMSADVKNDYSVLQKELAEYDPKLPQKPQLLVLTKIDLKTDSGEFEALESEIGKPLHKISALTGQGLADLKDAIWVSFNGRKPSEKI